METIPLSKPKYELERDFVQKHGALIRQDPLARVFIRRRIVFFMDGYRYAHKAVKKRWGIDFTFFEHGHAPMKEVFQSVGLNKKAAEIWLSSIVKKPAFAASLVKELREVLSVEKRLAASVPQRIRSAQQVEQCLRAHLSWWVRFFSLAFLWFAIDDVKRATDQAIKKLWHDQEQSTDKFLENVYRPVKFPLSSREQRDLLQLARLTGTSLERALGRHWKKYRHLAVHTIDDEPFNIDYYRSRVLQLRRADEYEKQRERLDAADREAARATVLLRSTTLPRAIRQQVSLVRWFMYLRTETIDHMMLVNDAYRRVFEYIAAAFDIPIAAALNMTYEELMSSLRKGRLAIAKEKILDRLEGGYAYLIAPYGEYLVTGADVDAVARVLLSGVQTQDVREVRGQSAYPGHVTGRVRIILDRKDAHLVEDGEVLVTPMTSPEFVPSMKRAAAIVTNEGGVLCHAAIMSRELRKPCIIGTGNATQVLKDGDLVEVDAGKGSVKVLERAGGPMSSQPLTALEG